MKNDKIKFENTASKLDKVKTILLPIDPGSIYTAFSKTDRGNKLMNLYNSVTLYKTDTIDKILSNYK